jgi:hypothetical protein
MKTRSGWSTGGAEEVGCIPFSPDQIKRKRDLVWERLSEDFGYRWCFIYVRGGALNKNV